MTSAERRRKLFEILEAVMPIPEMVDRIEALFEEIPGADNDLY